MNSIQKTTIHLPENIKDLAKFVLIGREQLTAVRAQIRAMDNLELSVEVREQKKCEAQMMAEALLDAEARMGELIKMIPKKAGGDHGNQHTGGKSDSGVVFDTKKKKLESLGFSTKDGERFEALADNKDLVEKVKAEARENDDLPTRSEVLRMAKERKAITAIETRKKEIETNLKSKVKNAPIIAQCSCQEFIADCPPFDVLLTDPPYSTDVKDIGAFVDEWLPAALEKTKKHAFIFIGAYPEEVKAYLNCRMPTQMLIWEYKNTLGNNPKNRYKQNYQMILYYQFDGDLNFPVTNEQWAVHSMNAPDGRLGDRYHAWQKPIELAERFIAHSTKEGDTVIDPFCCTGTFLLAAAKAGRKAAGCDISSDNIKIAIERGCVQHAKL